MSKPLDRLAIHVEPVSASDAEGLEVLTLQLRQELKELELVSVDVMRAGPAPPGARAIDAQLVGGLIVTLLEAGALPAVVAVLQGWLRGRRRCVRIEVAGDILEMSGISAFDQGRLVNDWIARHSAQRPSGSHG
jgi:hypothetical protein